MRSDALLAELEQDVEWREAELNELWRDLNVGATAVTKVRRRAAVALAYAHAEGFVKFALQAYIRFINAQALRCDSVQLVYVAWALEGHFNQIRQGTTASGYQSLGLAADDKKARKHYGEVCFLEKLQELRSSDVKLSEASLAERGQNLDERLLRALLYRCGLDIGPHTYAGDLNGLVRRRNEIAHGEDSAAAPEEVEAWFKVVRELMNVIRNEVYKAANDRRFLQSA